MTLTLAVAVVLIFTSVQRADAMLREGDPMFQANVAWATAKLKSTDTTVDGWGIGGTMEQITWDFKWALGLNIYYAAFREEVSGRVATYSTWPMFLTVKYYLFDGEIHPYLGAGFGVHISTLKDTEDGTTSETGDSGLALQVPVGILWELSENVAVNANYIASYTDSRFVDQVVHAVMVGLVFK